MVSIDKTGRQKTDRGFTLMELLVVIAIIALLMAIVFPVFSAMRENSRQMTTMSSLHDISAKIEQYRLDTHHYPPVLFGYAIPTAVGASTYVPMDKALDTCTSNPNFKCSDYLPGLYPEYINNISEFQDLNNPSDLTTPAGPAAAVDAPNRLFLCTGAHDLSDDQNCRLPDSTEPAGALVVASGHLWGTGVEPNQLYAADAFDSSPQVLPSNSIDAGKGPWITRYQTSWTKIDGLTLDCDPNSAVTKANPTPLTASNGSLKSAFDERLCPTSGAGYYNYYMNQLRWTKPPSGTYVTSTTWHVNQTGQVLVLTLDGSIRKIDAPTFQKAEAVGSPAGLSLDGDQVSSADFWKITR